MLSLSKVFILGSNQLQQAHATHPLFFSNLHFEHFEMVTKNQHAIFCCKDRAYWTNTSTVCRTWCPTQCMLAFCGTEPLFPDSTASVA
jgi:hypothetical protein